MITVSHLTKRYGAHTAVSDVSFTIEKGKVYGFLGPNGAGKSTTMNIITGCLAATEGEVTIDGHDIFEEPLEAKKRIGYLPEIPPLYTDMTPYEYLMFVAEAKGGEYEATFRQVREVMELTELEDVRDRLIRNLLSMLRRIRLRPQKNSASIQPKLVKMATGGCGTCRRINTKIQVSSRVVAPCTLLSVSAETSY